MTSASRPVALFASLILLTTGCTSLDQQPAEPAGTSANSILAELATVKVVSSRPKVKGYSRECGKKGACSFGQAWSDNHAGAGGHDGCDTRDNVLAKQLTAVTYKAGTRQCVVMSGTLLDPYTGRTISFRKAAASKVQIDHIYPLSRAWDLGASTWPEQRRIDFANDQTDNLLAVDGSTNASKSDQGPGEWLPLNKSFRCPYVARYLHVAAKYKLPITRDDQQAAQILAKTCT
ncbi:HNH endonuclease [Kribbella qitaiheensis]|uniref:HNH endonuclease n=1 Tax=Kribbella qitaiheensis TaxID=1544730 RepID=A0A7G6X474_9ACTN|nr:HNH endonuclease family protein [Kribbella qitaiheensis]QNE21039.1 HNH endonuclease [Kribbella qitaiheensis]